MVEQGKTLAPFNTTQFIMAEHRNEVPQLDCESTRFVFHIDFFEKLIIGRKPIAINSSDLDTETSVEDNYLNNEFNEEYEIIKLEYYKKLNKTDLLNECFQILTELNKLQNTVLKLTQENEALKKQLNHSPSVARPSTNDTNGTKT